MTKLELKIPQPGVTFYGNRRLTTVTILDIKVDDGVKEVFFEGLKDCDAIEVKIQSDCRCPSVEMLIFRTFSLIYNLSTLGQRQSL